MEYNKGHVHCKYHYLTGFTGTDNGIWIDYIEVDYNYRHKGLVRNCINELSKKYNKIQLECFSTLRSMYEHLGFKYIGDQYDGYLIMELK